MQLEQGEPHSPEFLKQSEHFAEIVLEYERQCQVCVGSCWDHGAALCICWPEGVEGDRPDHRAEGSLLPCSESCLLTPEALHGLFASLGFWQERVGVDYKFLPACSHGLLC